MSKPFKTIDEQIGILRTRGMEVDDSAYSVLLSENYYSIINGYKNFFLDKDKSSSSSHEVYVDGTRFDDVYKLFSSTGHSESSRSITSFARNRLSRPSPSTLSARISASQGHILICKTIRLAKITCLERIDTSKTFLNHHMRIILRTLVDFRNICAHDERLFCASVGPSKDSNYARMLEFLAEILPDDEIKKMRHEVHDLINEYSHGKKNIGGILDGMGIKAVR